MHRIRLDAAWEWQAGAEPARPARIRLPATISAGDRGQILTRVFHPPSGLADGVRLRLCFGSLPPETEVVLNGVPISSDDSQLLVFELPVEALEMDNRVCLQFSQTLPAVEPCTVGPCWLEIPPP